MTDPFQRYLRLLKIKGYPSGLDGLRTLVRRHLSIVVRSQIGIGT